MRTWVVGTSLISGTEWIEAESYAVHDTGVLAFYSDGTYFAKPHFMVGPLVKMFAPGVWTTVKPMEPLPTTQQKV